MKDIGKNDLLDVLERREWPMVWVMVCRATKRGGGRATRPQFGFVMGLQQRGFLLVVKFLDCQ